jgi:hypothetical protein
MVDVSFDDRAATIEQFHHLERVRCELYDKVEQTTVYSNSSLPETLD